MLSTGLAGIDARKVARRATGLPFSDWLLPATVLPSALTPRPASKDRYWSSGSMGRACMPRPAAQRKPAEELSPTTTEPSALTALPLLDKRPGRLPNPAMPRPAVQRKASLPETEEHVPTMTE